jgi:hypothetical protein
MTMSPSELEAEIDLLDELLLDQRRADAVALLDRLDAAQDDLALCIETADTLFRHGLLSQAEQWSDVASSKLFAATAPPLFDCCDLLWLKADIAWQQGKMAIAADRLSAVRDQCGPYPNAESLRLAALALVSLADGRRDIADSRAQAALALGDHLLQVKFAAGYVLRACSPLADQPVLSNLAAMKTEEDPEAAAYAEEARQILNLEGPGAMCQSVDSEVGLTAYKLARRYIGGVRNSIVKNAEQQRDLSSIGAVFVQRDQLEIPGPGNYIPESSPQYHAGSPFDLDRAVA